MEGLIALRSLTEPQLEAIQVLETACSQAESIRMKLNWSMMRERAGSYASDFLAYRDGRLVGYAPLDGFGSLYEVTALVLPEYRRQGIFSALFQAARAEARRCNATELLLVSYPASPSGAAVVERLGLPYSVSEYSMEALAPNIPDLAGSAIELAEVTAANVQELSRLLVLSFENARWSAPEALLKELENRDKRYYVAQLDGLPIGQIGTIKGETEVYIRAVGIVPERRGQGHGKRLLASTMRMLLAEGHTRFELEVATRNRQALELYRSCGFREQAVFDYWTVDLADGA